jgi:hypothetical protein
MLIVLLAAAVVAAPRCAQAGSNKTAAMWLSIAHPGLGEWYLTGWGNFGEHCPQNKFWLGFIPFYGWPGYLQVKSAIDAKHGRTNDKLTF